MESFIMKIWVFPTYKVGNNLISSSPISSSFVVSVICWSDVDVQIITNTKFGLSKGFT